MLSNAHTLLFLGNMRGWEILIIVVVILLLFGGKRIPELMRNVGKGIRGFKEGINDAGEEIRKGMKEDDSTKK